MQRVVLYCFFVLSLVIVGACSPKTTPEEEEKASALDSAKGGEMTTGEALIDDYVPLLCNKYDECGIKAFAGEQDCRHRIKAVLTQDSKWQAMSLSKKGVKVCLKEFKAFSCDLFKSGKSPPSCEKL